MKRTPKTNLSSPMGRKKMVAPGHPRLRADHDKPKEKMTHAKMVGEHRVKAGSVKDVTTHNQHAGKTPKKKKSGGALPYAKQSSHVPMMGGTKKRKVTVERVAHAMRKIK